MAQFIFIAFLLYSLRLYHQPRSNYRKTAYIRLFMVGIVFGGILLIIMPDLTNRLAQLLGIGRGADLLLYVSVLAGVVLAVQQIKTNQDLEQRVLDLNRKIAIIEVVSSASNQPERETVVKSEDS